MQYQGEPKISPTYLRTCPDRAAMSALLLPLTVVPLRHSVVAGTVVKTRVNCRTRTLGTTPGAVQASRHRHARERCKLAIIPMSTSDFGIERHPQDAMSMSILDLPPDHSDSEYYSRTTCPFLIGASFDEHEG